MSVTKKLFSGSLIILIGTLVGNFGAYIFNMLVGRFLGPDQYGDFTTLMSLAAILTVGTGAIMTVAMKYAGEYYALKDYGSLKKFFFSFTKYAAYLGIIIIALGIILTKPIGNFFAIHDRLSLYIIFFTMALSLISLIGRGYLQGMQKFNNVAITGIVETACRIVLGIGFIMLGYKIAGAMAGVAIATIIAYLYMLSPISKVFRANISSKIKKHIKLNRKEILQYAWPTLITTALLAISLNIDILAVKHYFSATDAGNYAAISTIGKIIFYITAPIVGVMFPLITERRIKGYKHYRIFLLSFLMVLVGAMIVLGVYYVMPGTVIHLLYGAKYTQYYYILPEVGFVYFLFSIVNLVVNYFMAIKKFAFIPIFLVVITTQILSIIFHHSSFDEVIKILIGTYGLLSALLLLYYFILKRQQLSQLLRGEYR
jgi:O-antigen/teichoic acid export membrane protein